MMSESEQTRQRVFGRLRDVLGEEAATTLMSDRPPFDWSEVATKTDVANLGAELRGEIEPASPPRSARSSPPERWPSPPRVSTEVERTSS